MGPNEPAIPELDSGGLRNFGLTSGAIIAALFGLLFPWLFDRSIPGWPWIVLAVLATWALIVPSTLRPVYRGWMRVGMILSRFTTPLVLGMVYFVVFVPVGLLRRLLGKDSMSRALSPGEKSYRVISETRPGNNLENPY